VVLIRAMRDSNVPKFLADDVPLFMAIVQDLFPGVKISARFLRFRCFFLRMLL
jgi:dynein heavy chain